MAALTQLHGHSRIVPLAFYGALTVCGLVGAVVAGIIVDRFRCARDRQRWYA